MHTVSFILCKARPTFFVSCFFLPTIEIARTLKIIDILLLYVHVQLLFDRPTANFGPLSKGHPHSPDVNHCDLANLARRSLGASQRGWVLGLFVCRANNEEFKISLYVPVHIKRIP